MDLRATLETFDAQFHKRLAQFEHESDGDYDWYACAKCRQSIYGDDLAELVAEAVKHVCRVVS